MTKEIEEYDIVEVVVLNPDVPEASLGDQGTVLMHHSRSGVVEALEVECVLPDGGTKWLGTFLVGQVRLTE